MKRNFQIIIIVVLLICALVLGAIALHPDWRQAAQDLFFSDQRVVLTSVRGRFIPGEEPLKAVKTRDGSGVFVEIFQERQDGALVLVTTIHTGHPEDGQFNFRGQVSRLVAADIDQDGTDELLVPTFDRNRQPRLNVFKYQPSLKEFQAISSPKLLE